MGPRKKNKCSVIVFDMSCNSEFKQEAIRTYLNICGDTYFAENLDSAQLILINTAETNNKKNDRDPRRYKNIVEATEMVAYNPANVKYIEDALPALGNWLEGIEVAVDALVSGTESALYDTFGLIVLSDLSAELNMPKENINEAIKNIRRDLNDIDAYIYFLGPAIPVPKMLRSKKDVYDWVQNLDPQNETTNVQFAIRILEECMGVICNMEMGLDLVQSYVNGRRGFPFTEPLKFQDLEIITACIKLLDCQSLLSLRRDKDGFPEKVYVQAEDQSKEVDQMNIIRGLTLHNKLVIIPQDVAKGVKSYNRFFKLLGFTDMSNVSEDYMLASSTSVVVPYGTKDPEIGGVNYIIKACIKMHKYGIALRAYMKNTRPKLYCLLPKENPLCFIAVEVPYAQDVQILYETKDCDSIRLKEDAYSDYDNVGELKNDIYEYLDSIALEGRVALHPSLRQNFNKRKMVTNLLRKIKDEPVEEVRLPLGELRIEFPEELYESINQNWFPNNEASMETDDTF
ncbi:hypothetical protein AMK59_8417 [Oryctes borbonicus]|uniref:Ku domain-containing protein n=1 Tax=Oryctes borbonicus TaxID=1629725 RepID=A0A0T6AV22_9SCAR|nr:hypothetical protein AMK59_8417 [Oryctes borbonicus]